MTTALLLVAPLFLTTTAAVPRYAHLTANAVIQLDDRLSIAAKTGSFGRSAFRSTGTYSAIHTGSQHDEHHFGCGALPRVDPNAPDGYPTLYVLARGNCTFVAKAAAAAAAGASAVVVYDSIPGMYFPFIASEGGDGGGASLSSTLSASACAYDCAAGSSIINASEVNLASALGGYRGRCGDASSCPSQLCALASPSGRATLPHPPGVRALCCVVNALMDMGTAEGADLAQLGGITAAFVSVGGGAALLEALNTSHTTSTPLIVRLIPAAHEERARGAKESPVGRLADAAAQSLLLWFAAAVIAIAALQSELRAISKWGPGLRCVVDDDAPSQSDDLRAGGSQIVDSGRLEPSQSGEAASPSLLGTGVAATSETAVLPSTGAGVGAARAPHDSNAVRLIEPVNAPGDFSAQWRELQSAISRDLIVMSTAISTSFRNLDLAAHPNSPGSSSDSPGDSVATQQASPSTPAMTTAPYTSVALAAPSLPTPHTDPSDRAVGGGSTGVLLESASTGSGSAHADSNDGVTDSNDGATASTIVVPGDNGPSAPSVRGSATTPTFPGHNRSLYSAMRDYTIAVPNGPFAQVMHRWAGWIIAPPALVLALLALIVLIALLLAVLALFLALIFAIIVSPALLVYALMVYSMSSIPRFGDVLLILFAFTFQVALATKYMRPLVVAVWPGAATIVLYRGSNSARSVIDMNARNAASDSHAPQAAPPVSSNSGSNSSSSTTRATPSASRLTLACLLAFILTVAITAAPTLLGENSPGMWILTDALSLAWCALLISGLDLSLRGLAKWFGFVVAAVAWFPVFRATDSALGLKGRVDSSVATLPTTRGEQLIQCGEGELTRLIMYMYLYIRLPVRPLPVCRTLLLYFSALLS